MKVSRRDVLKAAALTGAGLVLEIHPALADSKAALSPMGLLRITPDDVITLVVTRVEMGQGTATMQAQLLAEELAVSPSRLVLELATADRRYDNPRLRAQLTGGSTSTAVSFEPFRQAGATAREMLVRAAAASWRVPTAECVAQDGVVTHTRSMKSARYGDLAEAAAKQSLPSVTLKTKGFTVIGQPVPRVDAPLKVDGRAVFGLDVKVPGALTAVILRCPVRRGTVASFDAREAQAMPGVTHVVQVPSGVAVVGKTYWHAKTAAAKVQVTWDEGAMAAFDSSALRETHLKLLRGADGRRVTSRGDVDAVFQRAAKVVEAEYELPFLAHAPMEPQNATAHVTEKQVEIWAPSQGPGLAVEQVRRIVDKPVVFHQTWLGGGFGRRIAQDYVLEAVQVSKAIGQPVKVVWSREDDMRHSPYRPAATHRVRGALDDKGRLLGWHHRVATQSILSALVGEMAGAALAGAPEFLRDLAGAAGKSAVASRDMTAFEGANTLPYALDALAVDFVRHEPGVPPAFWRSVGHSHTAFATECFVDELAHAAGKDPVEFRKALLKLQHRHRWVLELAAEKAGWATKAPDGVGRGCAVHKSFESYCAAVAEVRVLDSSIRVERLVLAIDCGRVVNPELVKAQLESAAVFGLSATLHQEVRFEKGRVVQSNFHDYAPLRLSECPRLECFIRENEAAPTGVGEPGVPVIAPAVANAVFALTGKRLRSLPLKLGE
ncbi:MAG: molybdopterin cofactor-binding domain-containing protein [Myxococcota bacterium]